MKRKRRTLLVHLVMLSKLDSLLVALVLLVDLRIKTMVAMVLDHQLTTEKKPLSFFSFPTCMLVFLLPSQLVDFIKTQRETTQGGTAHQGGNATHLDQFMLLQLLSLGAPAFLNQTQGFDLLKSGVDGMMEEARGGEALDEPLSVENRRTNGPRPLCGNDSKLVSFRT